MSEEILRALMELFAILAKQDQKVDKGHVEFVKSFLQQQLSAEAVDHYFSIFETKAGIYKEEEYNNSFSETNKLTSVKDSVKILGICKKINKTLVQEQKVIVLVRLFELINNDRNYSVQRMAILETVANVFNIKISEFESIKQYINNNYENQDILLLSDKLIKRYEKCRFILVDALDEPIAILRIPSVDLYLFHYNGKESVSINGMNVYPGRVYVLAKGSTIKLPRGKPVYYSDIASRFLSEFHPVHFVYEVKNIWYRFPNGSLGLRGISFTEQQGNLVGIIGASGAGKTTLLNVLCGLEKPEKGEILINGVNLNLKYKDLKSVIGYVPQDDLLIEELTVYENLFFNALFCFKNKSELQIKELVDKTLINLGLFEIKDIKVGSVLNKTISGGQRKRLNIGLELIREPAILFVDEPTTGLSSRDAENVMDLLRELSLKGKLVITSIHQPSSVIFKMFDKLLVLDNGGYLIYYGNPVEAVIYFKTIENQINSRIGECPLCGNVNPETIFNIIESQVVDEYGKYTGKRKVEPEKWEEYYKNNIKPKSVDFKYDELPKFLSVPSWLKQFKIYLLRDVLSKLGNRQFVLLNLFEAPLLGLILSFITRYVTDNASGRYVFRENDNIPVYIFMTLIVALFLGLMISAEQIFRDRKIIRREAFLNLNRSAYLMAKIFVLFTISAIQSALFILIANKILGVKDMFLYYWLAMLATSFFAIIFGLNISATFNSAVTIYISIPLVMVPMMVLSGAMFSFEKINPVLVSAGKTPLIADLMPTRWTYEAVMVNQFKENKYTKIFYPYDKISSICDFKQVYYIPELRKFLDSVYSEYYATNKIIKSKIFLNTIRNEFKKLKNEIKPFYKDINIPDLTEFNKNKYIETMNFLNQISNKYNLIFLRVREQKEKVFNEIMSKDKSSFYRIYDDYYNESIGDIVTKVYEKRKIIYSDEQLIQNIDPIYLDPNPAVKFDFRAHFMAPVKKFMGLTFETFWFNIILVMIYSILFYFTLYLDIFRKILKK